MFYCILLQCKEYFPSLDVATNYMAKQLSSKIQHQSSCRCFDERLSTQCHEQGTGPVGQIVTIVIKYNENTWTANIHWSFEVDSY